jgi:2-polyprenyl-6-methoxyphenol hydroxylase-like FAD-dependent oxidoreductase
MSRVEHVPVLICGAGPAGLATATTLARHGVASLLVERRPVPSSRPRATGVSARSMEILRGWGLEEEARAGAPDVEWMAWTGTTLAELDGGSPLAIGLPTREGLRMLTPAPPACQGQQHVEPLLERHLRALGVARVERATALETVVQGPDGVRATVRDAAGAVRTVHADYLVAADGSRSALREHLGIPASAPEHSGERVAVYFRAPELWRLIGDRGFVLYLADHPEGPGTLIPAGGDDWWVYVREWDPGAEELSSYGRRRALRLIRLATGLPGLRPRIAHIESVTFTSRIAQRFREGRGFLVGDAAHQATPRGGTGLNAALQDGFDLGWRLAWTLRGWAGPALLDGYEAERRPLVEHTVGRSADPDWTGPEPLRVALGDLGGRIAHAWLPGAAGRTSTLDLLGEGLTLFTGPACEHWDVALAGAAHDVPVRLRRLDAVTARALGIRDGGALLARPDGNPVAAWPPGTAAREALPAGIAAATARTVAPRHPALVAA